MAESIQLQIELPKNLARLRLPRGVQRRLRKLLDKQDGGSALTLEEKHEAEGLVDLADLLSLIRLQAQRLNGGRG